MQATDISTSAQHRMRTQVTLDRVRELLQRSSRMAAVCHQQIEMSARMVGCLPLLAETQPLKAGPGI